MSKDRIPSQRATTTQLVGLLAGQGFHEAISEIVAELGIPLRSFDSVQAILDAAERHAPSVVLLSAHDEFRSISGIVELLAKRSMPLVLVVPSDGVRRRDLRAALAAGVAGIVLDEDLRATLCACLHAVQAGQTCVPREHWRQLEPPVLSSREKQILGLVVMGYMNSQIAQQLYLAESTVKSHLSSAFGKLGVRSRHEASELILDPDGGLGLGVLGLVGEPVELASTMST